MSKNSYIIVIISVLYGLLGCASVKAPEGGPKDNILPKLIATKPSSGSTLFSGKSIILDLSEEVGENNPKQGFLSPITTATATENGSRFKITPDSGWKPNTTYTLRLIKKIKDTKEGNLLKDTSIVFSTGPNLDTLALLYEIKSVAQKPNKSPHLLTLIDANGNHYFDISDSAGKGKMSNLKKGKYFLESFLDKNENYRYEDDEKNLSFDSIVLDRITRISFTPYPHKLQGIKVYTQRKQDTIIFESEEIFSLNEEIKSNIILKDRKRKQYRMLGVVKNIAIEYRDSIGNCLPDSIIIEKIDSSRSLAKIALDKEKRIRREKGKTLLVLDYNWKIKIPPKRIQLLRDSTWSPVDFKADTFSIEIDAQKIRSGKIKVKMDTISFYNQTGYKEDSVTIENKDLETTGMLSGEIKTGILQPIVVELLDERRETVEIINSKKFLFHVKPGKYYLQTWIDWNGDFKYTGGNKAVGRKAEPLYFYPQAIELKPGWDIENLDISPGF